MIDVIAIGELLIDFTPSAIGGEAGFLPKPGGAPANVAATVSKLGGNSAFIGKVGRDPFGQLLKGVLDKERVDTSGLVFDETAPTTIAFVHLDARGERSFSFYRRHCADTLLSIDELNLSIIQQSKVLCFGSVCLTDSPVKEAVLYAAQYAKNHGILTGFDPNYRPFLWGSQDEAAAAILEGLRLADIVKVSGEEMTLITGEKNLSEGTKIIADYGAKLVAVTLGADGSYFRYGETAASVPGVHVQTVDTNGAGDAFFGGLLYKLTRAENPLQQTETEIENAIRFANIAGALTTTKHGAISAIPTLEEVQSNLT